MAHKYVTILKCTVLYLLGCYNKSITYLNGDISNDVSEIPMGQIVSLINLSASCTQSFAFDCTLAPFIVGDVMYHYWEDRNGDTFNYYTGFNQRFLT